MNPILFVSKVLQSDMISIYPRLQPIGLNPSYKKYANADKSNRYNKF